MTPDLLVDYILKIGGAVIGIGFLAWIIFSIFRD
jgi:hypothetical protein